MKNRLFFLALLLTFTLNAQKEKNGTVYNEHPAINVVEEMQKAFLKGDTVTVASYLASDFKAFNGMNTNPDNEGVDKSTFLKRSIFWNENGSYLSIERSEGAYPDAIEYKKSGLWVQTWDQLKGVHNKTGVKLNMPIHRLFQINEDNKIKTMITYDDGTVFEELRRGFSTRKNGVIYDQHENINTVRKMVAALEYGDADTGFSYFTDDAQFSNLDMPWGETNSLAEEKAHFNEFLKVFTLNGFEVVGYPDYLEYDRGAGKTVQSWWLAKMTRKSDGKTFKLPMMFIHDFNDEGKITREHGYYSTSSLMAK